MHEVISEPISVVASFRGAEVKPVAFRWRGQQYTVTEVTLRYEQRAGDGMVHYFSLTDGANYFKLSFATANLQWRVEELSVV